jgi:hypothetical protein
MATARSKALGKKSVYDKYKGVSMPKEWKEGMSKTRPDYTDHDYHKYLRKGDRSNYFIKHGTYKGMK